jgi:phage FluMu protein Com
MPIRFACEHCGQKLSVGSHKAGTKANCPRCKTDVLVPADPGAEKVTTQSVLVMTGATPVQPPPPASPAEPPAPEPYAEPEPEPPPVEMPYLAFTDAAVDSHELVFDTSAPPVARSSTLDAPQPFANHDLVSFPRQVIYVQAGLLVMVALVCFTLGALMGGALLSSPATPVANTPCVISGFVQVTDGVVKKGDAGAVVIVLPQDRQQLDERAPAAGLRPQDAMPDETNRGLSILRSNGAGFAKADATGKYQVSVPRAGKYFLLVISRAKSGNGDEIDSLDLRKIARFFENANELIGEQKYRFSEERFVADRKFDVSFE